MAETMADPTTTATVETTAAIEAAGSNLNPEQIEHLYALYRSERMAGRPERAQAIKEAMARGEMIELVAPGTVNENVHPEKPVDPDYIMPARGGKKGSTAAWVAYAKNVSTIDSEVIDNATRDDIIGMLEARSIIPKV